MSWSAKSLLTGALAAMAFLLVTPTALGGGFTVTVQESPRLVLEGIATPLGDGTARVDMAWYLDSSPLGVAMVPLRSGPGEPRAEIELHMIAERDAAGNIVGYTKYGVLSVTLIDYPDAPIPEGISLLASVPPIGASGWSWSGIMWVDETTIMDSIEGPSGTPSASSSQQCEPLDVIDNEVRQVIDLGNGLVLIIVVRNGVVYMMVYEEVSPGCWRFAFAPQEPGPGNGWWGTPPEHTLGSSLSMVAALQIQALISRGIIHVPGWPLP